MRRWRERRSLTQTEAGQLLGCDLTRISKYETGAVRPSRIMAARIAEIAGIAAVAWDADVGE